MKFEDLTPDLQDQILQISCELIKPFKILSDALYPIIETMFEIFVPIFEVIYEALKDIDLQAFNIYLWLEQKRKYFGW